MDGWINAALHLIKCDIPLNECSQRNRSKMVMHTQLIGVLAKIAMVVPMLCCAVLSQPCFANLPHSKCKMWTFVRKCIQCQLINEFSRSLCLFSIHDCSYSIARRGYWFEIAKHISNTSALSQPFFLFRSQKSHLKFRFNFNIELCLIFLFAIRLSIEILNHNMSEVIV